MYGSGEMWDFVAGPPLNSCYERSDCMLHSLLSTSVFPVNPRANQNWQFDAYPNANAYFYTDSNGRSRRTHQLFLCFHIWASLDECYSGSYSVVPWGQIYCQHSAPKVAGAARRGRFKSVAEGETVPGREGWQGDDACFACRIGQAERVTNRLP